MSKTFLISRTDSIGDVVLTLPILHALKQKYPDSKIIFLGKGYTKSILECCLNIDQVVCWDEIEKLGDVERLKTVKDFKADCIIHVFPNKQVAALAKKAGIPIRIGTSHRLFHWFTCNKLPNFTRKNSDLHEVQLNFKLLEPLGIIAEHSLDELVNYFDFVKIPALSDSIKSLIDDNRYNLILHPKSKGSAVEWGIQNFSSLIKLLPDDKFKIFITGTKEERQFLDVLFSENPHVVDLTGRLSLRELISFINNCDGLVAASTGPLHLAAVMNKRAIGIYPSVRPIHPGRWAPIGKNASYLVSKKSCSECNKGKKCDCLSSVQTQDVVELFMRELK